MIVVAEHNRLTDLDSPGIRLDPSRNDVEQGGFAGAIGANDADAVAAFELVAEILQERLIAIALREAVQFQNLGAHAAGADGDFELSLGRLSRLTQQFFRALDSRLLFSRSRFSPAPQPGQFAAHQRLALLPFDGALLFLLFLFFEVVGIAPGKTLHRAAINFDDATGHTIQKVAVVRDEQERARVLREVGFKPRHGINIEMIGRLIEDQQIRAHDERMGQGDAFALTAGERRHLGSGVIDAELGQHHLGVRLQVPTTSRFELMGEIRDATEQHFIRAFVRRQLAASRFVIVQHLHRLAARRKNHVQHFRFRIEGRILREKNNDLFIGDDDAAPCPAVPRQR